MNYFSALTAFHSVIETGNFSSSARKLGVAVSSVSRQIDGLEAELGVSLFVRSTRQLTLTHAGQRYAEQTRRILNDLNEANLAAQRQYDLPQGKLRVAMSVTYGEQVIAPLLPEFCRRYPDIDLELDLNESFVDIVQRKFDVAIRLGKIEDTQLVAKILTPQRRLLAASPEYIAKHGSPEIPSEISRHNCLYFQQDDNWGTKWFFERNNQTEAITPRGNLRCNSGKILLEAARNGQGLTMLPDWLLAKDISDGILLPLLTDWKISTIADESQQDAVFAVYPTVSRNQCKVRVFVEFLAEKLGNGDGFDV